MICEACGKNPATQRHHKFHNVSWARRLYGKLMDDPKNIQLVCHNCNVSHAGLGIIHYTEREFCDIMKIEPRSKLEIARKTFRLSL